MTVLCLTFKQRCFKWQPGYRPAGDPKRQPNVSYWVPGWNAAQLRRGVARTECEQRVSSLDAIDRGRVARPGLLIAYKRAPVPASALCALCVGAQIQLALGMTRWSACPFESTTLKTRFSNQKKGLPFGNRCAPTSCCDWLWNDWVSFAAFARIRHRSRKRAFGRHPPCGGRPPSGAEQSGCVGDASAIRLWIPWTTYVAQHNPICDGCARRSRDDQRAPLALPPRRPLSPAPRPTPYRTYRSTRVPTPPPPTHAGPCAR